MLGPVQQRGVDEPLEAQQMLLSRQDLQKQAAGAQHPGKFLHHGQGEETENGIKAVPREGQMGRAGGDPMPGAIADGGVAHRVLGDIDAPELGVQRLGQGGAVIALAASGVQQAGPGRQMGLQQGQGRIPDGGVKPGVQKPLAGCDLGRGIPRMPGVLLLHRQEVYITLPRDVEAVPVRAAPG